MPLPQLKKELYQTAKVDFHIYTADRFLKLSETKEDKIDKKTIDEVRNIRELEEKKISLRRKEIEYFKDISVHKFNKYQITNSHLFEELEMLLFRIKDSVVDEEIKHELDHASHQLKRLRNRLRHGDFSKGSYHRLNFEVEKISNVIYEILRARDVPSETSKYIKEFLHNLKILTKDLKMIIKYDKPYF